MSKGRFYAGFPEGFDHPDCKMTAEMVAKAKELCKTMYQREVAEIFGVKQSTISLWVRGKRKDGKSRSQ